MTFLHIYSVLSCISYRVKLWQNLLFIYWNRNSLKSIWFFHQEHLGQNENLHNNFEPKHPPDEHQEEKKVQAVADHRKLSDFDWQKYQSKGYLKAGEDKVSRCAEQMVYFCFC